MKRGFTLVELAIVITVIGILATVATLSYRGSQDRARRVAVISQLDNVGKAIQTYSSQKGGLDSSGAGMNGQGSGWLTGKNTVPYTAVSIQDVLLQSGYLESAPSQTTMLVGWCTDINDPRRIVFARPDAWPSLQPEKSAKAVFDEAGCTNATSDSWATSPGYSAYNFAKVY